MAHWLTPYIGKPYLLGASGPGAFDCYGFVRWVLMHHYGRTNTELKDWSRLNKLSPFSCWRSLAYPHDGAVVMMESAGCPHIGVWVEADRGGIAHCIETFGVIFTSLSGLSTIGCRVISFYRSSEKPQ